MFLNVSGDFMVADPSGPMCTFELGSSERGPPLRVSTPPTGFNNVGAAGAGHANIDPPYGFYPPYQKCHSYSIPPCFEPAGLDLFCFA